MKKLVLVGMLLWLAGCGGTYKSIAVEYPVSPYAKYKELNLEITSPEDADKDELKSFEELIGSALQKRGIKLREGNESPKLSVEIINFNKDSKILRFALTLAIGVPFTQYTSNAIELKVSIKNKEKVIEEFHEFQEFQESIKDWEDLKKTVANRMADAVYFAH